MSEISWRRIDLPIPTGGRRAPTVTGLALLLVMFLGSACAARPAELEGEVTFEPVLAEAFVDRAVATTGDVITFRVKVNFDDTYEINMAEPGAEIAGFRIIDLGREDVASQSGRTVEERWYKLRADLVGSYILPPIKVGFRPKSRSVDSESSIAGAQEEVEVGSVETSAIFVEVASVLPSGGETKDIRGLKPVRRVRNTEGMWWFVAAAVLVVLAVLAFFWIRRRRRQPDAPPIPPHELAFDALRQLRQLELENLEQVRKFYFGISETIRAYVEGRFDLNATDLTTEEIVGQLNDLQDLEAQNKESLTIFLRDTDRVKFAEYSPSGSEIEETYEGALSFVESSIPRANPEVNS